MKRIDRKKLDKYIPAGITAFIVIVGAILVYILLSNFFSVMNMISMLNTAFTPIYIGLIIAFILSPVVNKLDKYVFVPFIGNFVKKDSSKNNIARIFSVVTSLLLTLLVLYTLLLMVVPELVNSLSRLIKDMPTYYQNVVNFGRDIFEKNSQAVELYEKYSNLIYEKIVDWLQKEILPQGTMMVGTISNGLLNIMSIVINFVIGIIISIYLLLGKEYFCGQAKKLLNALLDKKKVESSLSFLRETNTIFSKFISGKIIECLVLAIVVFLVMSIADVPYALLISVLIGVTNIIPFFGIYIGIIPSAFLVTIADPFKGLLFIILMIIIIQIQTQMINLKEQ